MYRSCFFAADRDQQPIQQTKGQHGQGGLPPAGGGRCPAVAGQQAEQGQQPAQPEDRGGFEERDQQVVAGAGVGDGLAEEEATFGVRCAGSAEGIADDGGDAAHRIDPHGRPEQDKNRTRRQRPEGHLDGPAGQPAPPGGLAAPVGHQHRPGHKRAEEEGGVFGEKGEAAEEAGDDYEK